MLFVEVLIRCLRVIDVEAYAAHCRIANIPHLGQTDQTDHDLDHLDRIDQTDHDLDNLVPCLPLREAIYQIQPRTRLLDRADHTDPTGQHGSAMKDLDHQVGTDRTDHTDHLSQVLNIRTKYNNKAAPSNC